MQTPVIIHPNSMKEFSERRHYNQENSMINSLNQETECLPEENVSITEDMSAEDKLENMKAIVNGTIRRKLYFNPAYFEPHLLLVNIYYYFLCIIYKNHILRNLSYIPYLY